MCHGGHRRKFLTLTRAAAFPQVLAAEYLAETPDQTSARVLDEALNEGGTEQILLNRFEQLPFVCSSDLR